ncbi:DUF1659 domain-containing protein [Parageobacillus thermoglucosidasius]|jgi:hypothetical protein|uniref:DUF1659 domain-containing protein n=3 Tax=Anoxybacillaceae TaxID=3120669 RepID=A0AB38R682_PARTM|nr:DUF1659 domain-containing protein [Parageobacillus thermoglucosidasius]ANZ32258.1 hypothetical protein BCV53_19360 [Parageobacillus thermoglucosidasius]APM82993.1 hypothetical protein BCV54_19380 [Parageobacillus thermoglucosidasius]KJX67442.1 hypothetical protein WH82_17795 [Parageobacillus thermoglucosidasius]MBY6269041.1 DUF1659 domain-containing protein [Parageobacillus thermoglucosidasius]MED4904042.1 DUF1659 domain-containing protein [Parageobacillus thermoglucosidasius]
MAATELVTKRTLAVVLFEGKDSEGKDIFRSQSFSNIKYDADIQSLYDAAAAIASLCGGTLSRVETAVTSHIMN